MATKEKDFYIHESSYIDEDVSIGAGTKIWHFSHILGNCSIGKNCSLGQMWLLDQTLKLAIM